MDTLRTVWRLVAMMSPWLLFGFFLAGVLACWIPRSLIRRHLGGQTGWRGIVKAVAFGVPLPLCSCGVLPLAAGLRKSGAGKAATAAFLISTPQTGVDSILATYALMGPVFALFRPLAALVSGLLGGGIVYALTRREPPVVVDDVEEDETQDRSVRALLWQGFVRLFGAVARPLLVGLLISALLAIAVPDDFFATSVAGNDWIAMPLMLLIGFPMYVCSTASIPIAATLLMKGLTPGAVFVFLMVGPAMNAISLTTISSLLGRAAAIAYLVVIAAGALFFGVMMNLLSPEVATLPVSGCHGGVSLFQQGCGVVLLSLLFWHLVLKPVLQK